MDGKEVRRVRRSLSSGSEDHRPTPYLKRNPRKAGACQLCRLLFELNRPVPNGTLGGGRGATC